MASVKSWLFRIVVGLVTVIVVAIAAVYFSSSARFSKHWSIKAESVVIPTDSTSIAWGEHIAATRGCRGCHQENLAGGSFINSPMFAVLYAPNLTPGKGGAGSHYTDADWVRSIRHGVRPDSVPLVIMPSEDFNMLSARDLGALIAWLKRLPPVDTTYPKAKVGPLARVFFLSGTIPLLSAEVIQHDEPPTREIPAGETPQYGEYLALACRGCHGNGFSGGKIPGAPPEMKPARNLTADGATGMGKWTLEEFRTAVRTGMLPGGIQMDTLAMPIPTTRHLSDLETSALWLYFRSLPVKQYGNR